MTAASHPTRAPLGALVDRIRPWLPARLVPEAHRGALRALGEHLPPCFSWTILETRLHGPLRTDVLLASVPRLGDPRPSPDHPLLSPVRGVLEAMAPGEPLADCPFFMVEVDLEDGAPPGVFTHVRIAPYRPWVQAETLGRDAERARLAAGLAAMRGHSPLPEEVAAWDRVIDALPAGAACMHINVPVTRDARWSRMDVSLSPADARVLLDRVGWPGDRALAHLLLDAVALGQELTSLTLCVRDGRLTAHVSAELIVTWHDDLAPKRRSLQALARLAPIDPDRAADALAWVGVTRQDRATDPWPVLVDRYLDVKTTIDPAGSVVAKAYLTVLVAPALLREARPAAAA